MRPMRTARLIASSSVQSGQVGGKSRGCTRPAASALSSSHEMISPLSQCSWQSPPWAAIVSMAAAIVSSDTIRFLRFLYVMNILNEVTPRRIASGMPSRSQG